MKQKKASLLMSGFIIFLVAFLIVIIIIFFFTAFDFGSSKKQLIISKAEVKVSSNVFLLGIMRSGVKYQDNTIPFSELILMYYQNDDIILRNLVEENLAKKINEIYSKNICYAFTIQYKDPIENKNNCEISSKDETVESEIYIPTMDEKYFTVKLDLK